jgi:membrane-associated phospholipid phosphatase
MRSRGRRLLIEVALLLLGLAGVAHAQASPLSETDGAVLAQAHIFGEPVIDFAPSAPESADPAGETLAGVLAPVSQAPAQATPPAEPHHTGFAALIRTTGADFVAFPKRRSTWAILAVGGGTALLVHPADDNVNAHLVGSDAVGRFFAPGKWIGSTWVQTGGAITLYIVGRYVMPHKDPTSKTNKVSHLGFDLLRAQIVSQALVHGIKLATQRDRPTGECCSFPSGHAATTFATASVLERHFGYRAAWPTMLLATYVGMSRLHDNRHFLSHVVIGSAVGIASGWTVVGRHGRSNYSILPTVVPGGVAIMVARVAG